jgi:ribonuclease HII
MELIICIDEAGRGPWAGPLTAAVVVCPKDKEFKGVKDSKKMSEDARENSIDLIHKEALFYRVGQMANTTIDQFGLEWAWDEIVCYLAMEARREFPDAKLIVDGDQKVAGILNQVAIPKADTFIPGVSAASVLAKYAQTSWMNDYHVKYPVYGFNKHRGYGTPQHMKALEEHGPCPIHRMSFRPLKTMFSRTAG